MWDLPQGRETGAAGEFLVLHLLQQSLRWEIVDPAATDAWTQCKSDTASSARDCTRMERLLRHCLT